MLTVNNIYSLLGVSRIVFQKDAEYTAIVSYSSTSNFVYVGKGIETRGVTWTVKSKFPIVGGTFLDNTPWIVDNGDIRLESVSPQSTSYQALHWVTNPPSGTTSTYFFDANLTIINPDFGKMRNVSSVAPTTACRTGNCGMTGVRSLLYVNTNNIPGTSLTTDGLINPTDGRAGLDPDANFGTTLAINVGQHYDSSQKWNNASKTLKAGDMVITGLSHFEDYKTIGQTMINGVRLYTDGTRRGLLDTVGILTIIGATHQAIAKNSYRPPVNWDPADRANAPILQELDNFEGYTFEYGNYDFDGPKTWTDNEKISYLYTSNPSDFLKLGSVLMTPYQHDAFSAEGSRFTRDVSSDEYSTTLARIHEILFLTTLDAGISAATRNDIRRCLVQRGIDSYGAYRSLGKGVDQNGGHNTFLYTLLPIAYLATKYSDIFNIMQMENIGNTANETFHNRQGWIISDFQKYMFGGHGQMWKYPKELMQENFQHTGRWNNLTILGITSGTTSYGSFQKITVSPPTKSTLESGTTYAWQPDDLYNVSKADNTRSGRWSLANNNDDLVPNMFLGGYIQNPSKGSTFISRIITNTILNGSVETYLTTSTNLPIVFYLRSNIFDGGETYCNLSPAVQEDIDSDNVCIRTITNNSGNFSYPFGEYTYTYSPIANFVSYLILHRAVLLAGLPLPNYVQRQKQIVDYILNNGTWGRILIQISRSTSYTLYHYKTYMTLLRQFGLTGNTGATLGPIFDITNQVIPDRVHFPSDRTDWTWIPIYSGPSGPTGITIVGNIINLTNNGTQYYERGKTAIVGSSHRTQWLSKGTTAPTELIVNIESRSPSGISYTNFISKKNLYLWVAGAQKSIKMTKIAETPPTTNDRAWIQRWALPTGPNGFTFSLWEKYPFIGDFSDIRHFFADP